MRRLNFLDWIVLLLVVIGGLNWGTIGLFNLNLVDLVFGAMPVLSKVVYVVVGLAALYTLLIIFVKLARKK